MTYELGDGCKSVLKLWYACIPITARSNNIPEVKRPLETRSQTMFIVMHKHPRMQQTM